MSSGLSNERLYNLIIFVIGDQYWILDQMIKNGLKAEKFVNLKRALSTISTSPEYICAITHWVRIHQHYLKEPVNPTSKEYYDMIMDAIYIEYYGSFDKSVDQTEFAHECELKYSKKEKEN